MKVITKEHQTVKPSTFPFSVVEMRGFYGCRLDLIATKPKAELDRDIEKGEDVLTLMGQATVDAGFQLMDKRIIRFKENEGVTVAQLLAESLSDMHTYPEIARCAQVWLDYCSFERDNADLATRWWDLTTNLLAPTHVVKYPIIYVPVHPPAELGLIK